MTEPLKLSSLAYGKILHKARKEINSPIKYEAEIMEKKVKPLFELWRKHFRSDREKTTIRDAKKTTDNAITDGIRRWYSNSSEIGYRDHPYHLIGHLLLALKDTPDLEVPEGPPGARQRGKYQNFDFYDRDNNRTRQFGGHIAWYDFFNDWINNMDPDEAKKFIIGYFNRNYHRMNGPEFAAMFFEYLHFNDYMNDPNLLVDDPEGPPGARQHIDMSDDGGRFNVDRTPNPYLFFDSYLKTLNIEEKINLYNNLHFQSNIKRGYAPQEDTEHITNTRYFIPKFIVDGELAPAGKKGKTVKKRDKKNKISKKKPKKIKKKRRTLKRKS